MKIAIYCRVSTSEQNPENQRIRLTEYARAKGWDYEVYSEVETTRKTRPVKVELLHKLRNGKYDGVLVYKLDRWARSSTELILDINELVKKGITFISYTEKLDFSTSTGRLHFQILSAFAECERALISERTKEGIRRARMKGKTLGRPFPVQRTRKNPGRRVIFFERPEKNSEKIRRMGNTDRLKTILTEVGHNT
jgi:putative DNA-invertase from lambdoid prophage Rac